MVQFLRVMTVAALVSGVQAQEQPVKPAPTVKPATGGVEAGRHKELGAVRWQRDFDAALAEGKKTGKPVLVLFDEVPGCATCVGFGETVLSHPLIVEAAEDLFVPVAVFNNVGGADRKVLESFKEPAMNNPVVRVVDGERQELAERVDGDYTARGVVKAMTVALAKAGRTPPRYLSILEQETRAAAAKGTEEAIFAMHCFWTGEAELGALDGVLSTRPGFANGEEVVEVVFDPTVLPRAQLEAKAREASCSNVQGKPAIKAAPKQNKNYVQGTAYAAVPMTPAQAAKVNAAVSKRGDAKAFLSPRQLELLGKMERVEAAKRPNMIGRTDLAAAWREAEKTVRTQ